MIKLIICFATLGASLALIYEGLTRQRESFFDLGCVVLTILVLQVIVHWIFPPKRILADHDPNTPFTADELRRIGIIPPERYDEWLDEYARR